MNVPSLNSSPGKGIIDTGCAKMMMGSDTFKQYLDLLSSKERASVEKVREKNPFQVRGQRDEDAWSIMCAV